MWRPCFFFFFRWGGGGAGWILGIAKPSTLCIRCTHPRKAGAYYALPGNTVMRRCLGRRVRLIARERLRLRAWPPFASSPEVIENGRRRDQEKRKSGKRCWENLAEKLFTDARFSHDEWYLLLFLWNLSLCFSLVSSVIVTCAGA